MDRITEIKQRLEKNKDLLKKTEQFYIDRNAPQGYKSGTSYLDADCIHGSKKEYGVAEMVIEMRRIQHMIELDTNNLEYLVKKEELPKKLEEFPQREDKIKYLREVMEYTQAETAEVIGLSVRQIQRIEAENRREE